MVGCVNRMLLVVCLVLFARAQACVLADLSETIDSPPPVIVQDNTNREITEGLFEGDIVLTPEQKLLLQQRKAIRSALFWPKDLNGTVTVGYRFGDDVINRTQTMVGVTQWEQNTCIRFKEVASNVNYPHIIFVDSMGCSSYVGRIASMTNGQYITLAKSCVGEVGPTVHEIGHALGFYHEQSRSDRDNHVKIIFDNINSGVAYNFNKEITFNYEVPYDYSSVMHYGPYYFTSNNKETIAALDPLAQPLMGNRVGLTFADKLMANAMYGCLDQWLTACTLSSDPCRNLGYTGSNCNCVCPEGTSGSQCHVLEDSYTDALIKKRTPYSERITTEGVVSTPGYPTPIQKRMTFVKVIVAPACHTVELNVTDFHVYPQKSIDALTIRTSNTLGSGTQYCGTEIAIGTVFRSETNTIVLDYFNYDYTTLSWSSYYRGFRATIKHIPITGCTTTLPPSSTTTGPLQVTFVNSGRTPLTKLSSSTGSCNLGAPSTARVYELTSGGYPFWYWPGETCNLNLNTVEPRYLNVTVTEMFVGSTDTFTIKSMFDADNSITLAKPGSSYVIPSTSVNIYFKALSWWFLRRFKISINVLNSNCHQIVRVEAGAPGTLTQTNYGADTVCEWWIQAPSGRKIRLDFTAFKVGQFDCSSDYLAIDTSGDPRYKADSQQYCGRNTPGSVTSTGGQLNVLLYGLQGGYPGFTATYTVV